MTVRELIEELKKAPQDAVVKAEIVSDGNSVWGVNAVWVEKGVDAEIYLSCGW